MYKATLIMSGEIPRKDVFLIGCCKPPSDGSDYFRFIQLAPVLNWLS